MFNKWHTKNHSLPVAAIGKCQEKGVGDEHKNYISELISLHCSPLKWRIAKLSKNYAIKSQE